MSIFEKATRLKICFETTKGLLGVEDMWDLPLLSKSGECLDNVARELFKKLKDSNTESFVLKSKGPDEILQLKFDIVKRIIEVKLAEEEDAERARTIKEEKQFLLQIKAEKAKEELKSLSVDDINKRLADLEAS